MRKGLMTVFSVVLPSSCLLAGVNKYAKTGFSFRKIILLLGIVTFIALITAVISGWRKWPLKVHKLFALAVVVLAACHASLVIYANIR
ncbi:MAG: hypothetical protein ABIH39_01405 [Candidatus Margulisiibacteriota bacterium]